MSEIRINHPDLRATGPHASRHARGRAAETTDVERDESTPPSEPLIHTEAASAEAAEGGTEGTVSVQKKAKGVLRLLQEGHFRGVADVRLRINFHEEINAARYEAAKPVVQDSARAVVDAVSSHLALALPADGLSQEELHAIQEAEDAFGMSVHAHTDEAMGVSPPDMQSLMEKLTASFDNLVESLRAVLDNLAETPADGPPGPDEVDPVALDPVPPDGTPEATAGAAPLDPLPGPAEATGLDALIEGLSQAFMAALQDLDAAHSAAVALPPLSPPTGNGVAYWKFLEVYRQLNGLVDDDSVPPTVDATA